MGGNLKSSSKLAQQRWKVQSSTSLEETAVSSPQQSLFLAKSKQKPDKAARFWILQVQSALQVLKQQNIYSNMVHLTSGGAGDAAAALPQAGAVHHHPALVGLFPGLTHHIGCSSRVIIAPLG